MKNTGIKNFERIKKIDKNYEGQIPLYKYWLQERVTWEIVT